MIIAGVDEAGVGCWAGPMVVVTTAFDEKTKLPKEIRDSKRLSMEQRENLIDRIYDLAEWVIIKIADSSYIDSSAGIWSVWDLLVKELLEENQHRGAGKIIVDGVRMIASCKGITYEVMADDKYREVSAASIVAKYVQTSAMEDLHDQFKQYGFDQHHGYGTEVHRHWLELLGPTSAHRMSYRPVAAYLKKHPKKSMELRQLSLFNKNGYRTIVIKRK
jgi:ribonuclease HII